jgi:hypothetical protein
MDSILIVLIITLGILMLTAMCTLPIKGATYVNKFTVKISRILSFEFEKKEKRSDKARQQSER